MKIAYEFKLIDFKVSDYSDDSFRIQMFGINDIRKTFSVTLNDFRPFVYLRIGSHWTKRDVDDFIKHFKEHPEPGIRYNFSQNLIKYEMIKKKTLYDFDANKYYKFVCLYAPKNVGFINKLKSLYYDREKQRINEGYLFNGTYTKIYECMIPPLLRFFHIQNISPSGWVRIEQYRKISSSSKQTRCDYEFECKFSDIISSMKKKHAFHTKSAVFDIEAKVVVMVIFQLQSKLQKVAYDVVNYYEKMTWKIAGLSFKNFFRMSLDSKTIL